MTDFNLYINNGITARSNNPDIIKRDDNGNMILYSGQEDNQKLVIETVTERYTKRSVINSVDTQFRYFTFPTREVVTDVVPNIDLNLGSDDIAFARYTPAESYEMPGNGPLEPFGIEFSVAEVGLQPQTNKYYVTQQIADLNVPLRFRLRITVENRNVTTTQNVFNRNMYIAFARTQPDTGLIRNWSPGNGIYFPEENIEAGEQRSLDVDITVPRSEFDRGTTFQVAATGAGPGLFIVPGASYWVISDATQNTDLYGELNA
jgi:hypothetical protein